MNIYKLIIGITVGIFLGFEFVYMIHTTNYINKKFSKEDRIIEKINRNVQFIMANLFVFLALIAAIMIHKL